MQPWNEVTDNVAHFMSYDTVQTTPQVEPLERDVLWGSRLWSSAELTGYELKSGKSVADWEQATVGFWLLLAVVRTTCGNWLVYSSFYEL